MITRQQYWLSVFYKINHILIFPKCSYSDELSINISVGVCARYPYFCHGRGLCVDGNTTWTVQCLCDGHYWGRRCQFNCKTRSKSHIDIVYCAVNLFIILSNWPTDLFTFFVKKNLYFKIMCTVLILFKFNSYITNEIDVQGQTWQVCLIFLI